MSEPVPVLVFQVGPRLFAAPAGAVARVAGRREELAEVHAESCLGRPFSPAHRLVARQEEGDGGEAALAVDQVLGLRAVPPEAVRPLPSIAEGWLATRAVAGLVLLDDAPTPLIDLPTLIREQRDAAARRPRSDDA